MKVIHDSGTYYVDIDIERFDNRIDPKPSLFIYQDKVLWKRRISSYSLNEDYTEEELSKEISKVLTFRQKEIELNNKIKKTIKSSLNLLSVEFKREQKLKSIF